MPPPLNFESSYGPVGDLPHCQRQLGTNRENRAPFYFPNRPQIILDFYDSCRQTRTQFSFIGDVGHTFYPEPSPSLKESKMEASLHRQEGAAPEENCESFKSGAGSSKRCDAVCHVDLIKEFPCIYSVEAAPSLETDTLKQRFG